MGKKNKSKAPKGRAAAKQKAKKGSPGSGSWQNNFIRSSGGRRQTLDEDDDYNPLPQFQGFAQTNTPTRNFTPRTPTVRLRHQTISFVSAGANTPAEFEPKPSEEALFEAAEESEEEVDEENDLEFDDSNIQTNVLMDTDMEISEGGIAQMNIQSSAEMSGAETANTSSDLDDNTVGRDAYSVLLESLRAIEHNMAKEVFRSAIFPALPGLLIPDKCLQTIANMVINKRPAPTEAELRAILGPVDAPPAEQLKEFVHRISPTFEKASYRRNVPGKQESMASSAAPAFFVDTVGDPSLAGAPKINGKRSTRRAPSPTPSDSSEEAVVFQGRNKPLKAKEPMKVALRGEARRSRANNSSTSAATTQQSRARLSESAPSSRQNRVNEAASFSRPLASTVRNSGQATVDASKTLQNLNAVQERSSAPNPGPLSQPLGNDTAANEQPNRQSSVGQTPITDPEFFSRALPALEGSSSFSNPTASSSRTAIGWGSRASKLDEEVNNDATWAPAPAGSWWKKKGKQRPDLDPSPEEQMALDEAPTRPSKVMFIEPKAEETIASLQAEVRSIWREKDKVREKAREQDRISLDLPKTKRRGKNGRKRDNRRMREPITSDGEDDDAEEAAYDDYMSNLAAQLDEDDTKGVAQQQFSASAFSAVAGESSLVVDGEEIGEDEVLPNHVDLMNEDGSASDSDSGPIGQDLSDEVSDFDSSDLEDEIEYTEREQWEDEEDLRQRAKEAKTDEQIARMYAKQQEFGYHGDDLMIDDGEYMSITDMDGVGDIASARAGLADISNFASGRSSNKHGMRRRSGRGQGNVSFPNASALADTVDQYGEHGFDIMDLDRPSLRPTKKGRKGKLPPELEALSDDDLKETVRSTWENDRRKKSEKKAEREELRAQGWLGSSGKKGKADFSVKYPLGMTKYQIHDELRIFLLDENQRTRPFPPMDRLERKALHDIANVLDLGSKSIGSGKSRFPTLHKTLRTPYTPEMIDKAIDMSMNGLLNRDLKLGKGLSKRKAQKMVKSGGVRGADKGAASLRHGEVVGAGAAAIGESSFGHKMMEKMGWSRGMALGRDGEGRLVPVEQVVKLGTAGLG
ncbi:squalene synthetase-like protein [Vermiconidia calcicola]|uniref:Squalene synthetase-like protein n=1 Tax=Vermiconidia calcicola TaxID=1690605 RepID=A0ACC3N351_9PEZI|nr:squalene synthetase-like protein [Vermiconidia calcicola]